MLTQSAYALARRFLAYQARPLEAARARFHLDGAASGDVIAALAAFQNPDGGFGRALEPDLRTPRSSALATMHAFEVLRELGGPACPAALELARPAVTYLLQTFDPDAQVWRIIPPEAGESPHAPWWNQDSLEETFHAFVLNPTANLLGALYDFPDLAPVAFVETLTRRIQDRLRERHAISESEFSACVHLSQSANLPAEVRRQITAGLLHRVSEVVMFDPARWPEYNLRPLQVARQPQSPFFAPLQEAIAANFAYDERIQNPDGSWSPNWSWFGQYPAAWEQAKAEWTGVVTLEKVLAFHAYGMIAP